MEREREVKTGWSQQVAVRVVVVVAAVQQEKKKTKNQTDEKRN